MPASAEQPGTEYHFVLTAQMPTPRGIGTATSYGTVTLDPGTTRAQAYDFLLGRFCQTRGWSTADVGVSFFSLEPNQFAA